MHYTMMMMLVSEILFGDISLHSIGFHRPRRNSAKRTKSPQGRGEGSASDEPHAARGESEADDEPAGTRVLWTTGGSTVDERNVSGDIEKRSGISL
ncbi:MAG: hypothetical protein M3501_03805 [Actinomycetota bacterium]|nr:hypothetical protein [Actinomycetota bacterium]MDQ3351072.1 hypothetical protein [Actinomycetota bacterium]